MGDDHHCHDSLLLWCFSINQNALGVIKCHHYQHSCDHNPQEHPAGKKSEINLRKEKEFNTWNFLTWPQSSMQYTCHYIHNLILYSCKHSFPKHNRQYENNSIHMHRKDVCHTSAMWNCPFSHLTNFLHRLKVVTCTPWWYVWNRGGTAAHILRLCTWQRQVINFTPWPLYSRYPVPALNFILIRAMKFLLSKLLHHCQQPLHPLPTVPLVQEGNRHAHTLPSFVWVPCPALATAHDTLLGCQATLQVTFLTCSCILHNFLMCHWDVTSEIGLQTCRPTINFFNFGIRSVNITLYIHLVFSNMRVCRKFSWHTTKYSALWAGKRGHPSRN